jgi:hypothetical protein
MTTNLQPAFDDAAGAHTHDNLIAGDGMPVVTESIVLDTGNLTRGAVLGRISSSGKYVLSLAAANDGSQTPVAILAENANATSADVTTVAYLAGEFNTAALTFGTGHTAASTKAGLRDVGIFLKTNLAA